MQARADSHDVRAGGHPHGQKVQPAGHPGHRHRAHGRRDRHGVGRGDELPGHRRRRRRRRRHLRPTDPRRAPAEEAQRHEQLPPRQDLTVHGRVHAPLRTRDGRARHRQVGLRLRVVLVVTHLPRRVLFLRRARERLVVSVHRSVQRGVVPGDRSREDMPGVLLRVGHLRGAHHGQERHGVLTRGGRDDLLLAREDGGGGAGHHDVGERQQRRRFHEALGLFLFINHTLDAAYVKRIDDVDDRKDSSARARAALVVGGGVRFLILLHEERVRLLDASHAIPGLHLPVRA